MRAQYRFAAGSICLLLLQSIGGFCANTGFAQLAPAVVAAAQDLPSRAALAVPNEVLIIFRHDAPQNVEDFARDYRLVHIESYTDSLLGRTVHHFRISNADVPVTGLPNRSRMRSTSPRSEQAPKKDDESSQENADAARIDEYISLLSSDPRIESVQPNYVYERKGRSFAAGAFEDWFSRPVCPYEAQNQGGSPSRNRCQDKNSCDRLRDRCNTPGAARSRRDRAQCRRGLRWTR